MNVDIGLVNPPTNPLRPVDKTGQDYRDLRDEISETGIHVPIIVRHQRDQYECIDGNHRLTAASELKLATVPVDVKDWSDSQVEEYQLKINLHRIATKPVDVAKRIRVLVTRHPERTLTQQAKALNKSPGWLTKTLRLSRLTGEAARLVNAGDIPIDTGVALSSLKGDLLDSFLSRAKNEPAHAVVPDILRAARNLKKTAPNVKVRAKKDIQKRFDARPSADLAWVLSQDTTQFAAEGFTLPESDTLYHWANAANANPLELPDDLRAKVEDSEDRFLNLVMNNKERLTNYPRGLVEGWVCGTKNPTFKERMEILNELAAS